MTISAICLNLLSLAEICLKGTTQHMHELYSFLNVIPAFSSTDPQTTTLNRSWRLMLQTTRIGGRTCLLGYLSLNTSELLNPNWKSSQNKIVEQFVNGKIRMQTSNSWPRQNWVKGSVRDVYSSPKRVLTAEIGITPLPICACNVKRVEDKTENVAWNLIENHYCSTEWWHHLLSRTLPGGQNRHSALMNDWKTHITFERCIEHYISWPKKKTNKIRIVNNSHEIFIAQ